MKYLVGTTAAAVLLAGCGEPAPVEEAPAETLDSYSASGTEPFWSVELDGDQISHDSPQDFLDFTVPVMRSKRTETGWEIKGFDGENNITLDIELGKECSDGMSDRVYADTVRVAVAGAGYNDGCGGAFTGPEAP